ncbi:uncharacterized protein METZ01_LOCUS491175, partial [marine metagenome]
DRAGHCQVAKLAGKKLTVPIKRVGADPIFLKLSASADALRTRPYLGLDQSP